MRLIILKWVGNRKENKMKKKELEKMTEECWDLGNSLVKWLNEHLKFFKEDVTGIINLEFHTYIYNGKEYTQLEIINRLIELTEELQDVYSIVPDDKEKMKDEMYDLLKLVHFDLWWWFYEENKENIKNKQK